MSVVCRSNQLDDAYGAAGTEAYGASPDPVRAPPGGPAPIDEPPAEKEPPIKEPPAKRPPAGEPPSKKSPIDEPPPDPDSDQPRERARTRRSAIHPTRNLRRSRASGRSAPSDYDGDPPSTPIA